MEASEKAIPPPASHLTVKLNLAILRYYYDYFAKKYFPAFGSVVTSEYRDEKRNKEVGGALNSAHVHGLARDVVLTDLAGTLVPKEQARRVFDDFIKPHWPGFALWEDETRAPGYHIHLNLSRQITTYAAAAGIAGIGVIGIAMVRKFLEGSK